MNEINKNKENTEIETKTRTRIEKELEREAEAEPKNGSPMKKPCTTIALSGTANEHSAAEPINTLVTAGSGRTPNTIRSVPLYLIPQAVSREIHTHKGRISEIVIRRTARHDYAIMLTTRGEPHAD